ncbi:MAG: class I SAM-dependent methyltransferase [Phycisphaerales bacterium]|nr:class I SAM-dependent methyltransferase [Phycisphaerales bacterium]MDG1978589.1 class I SAM-dependent methyltransferase [Phycisphaerales bacterium]MDG2132415.1 class I SAM-dependent methyltransferase [Phycisphaerales bacterium]
MSDPDPASHPRSQPDPPPERDRLVEFEVAVASAASAGMVLEMADGALELRTPEDRAGTGVRGEIESALRRRLEAGHPLRRIVHGLGETPGPVVDLTGGLGADTAIAAASTSSRRVVTCERHPVVATLLEDGRLRAVAGGLEPASRIDVHHGDAVRRLRQEHVPPALVMIDPMFPPRRKSSALPPKPMQRLRTLLHDAEIDVDAEVHDLLVAAQRVDAGRIVLKRPPDAIVPDTSLGPPTFEISTKLLRWSVWERRSRVG